MKRRTVLLTGMWVLLCVAVPTRAGDVEGGLVVCIGADALESVSDDWKKPGCVFHCLETSDAKVSGPPVLTGKN